MATEYSEILDRLAAGEISADEAAELLRRPGRPFAGTPKAGDAPPAGGRLRVRVSSLHTGRTRVNVNVPLTWVEAGMKLGACYDPGLARLDFDEIVEEIRSGAGGKIVDVEDLEDGERVEVFLE